VEAAPADFCQKYTSLLVFSPVFGVATTVTWLCSAMRLSSLLEDERKSCACWYIFSGNRLFHLSAGIEPSLTRNLRAQSGIKNGALNISLY
jgi:hypothetical protein